MGSVFIESALIIWQTAWLMIGAICGSIFWFFVLREIAY